MIRNESFSSITFFKIVQSIAGTDAHLAEVPFRQKTHFKRVGTNGRTILQLLQVRREPVFRNLNATKPAECTILPVDTAFLARAPRCSAIRVSVYDRPLQTSASSRKSSPHGCTLKAVRLAVPGMDGNPTPPTGDKAVSPPISLGATKAWTSSINSLSKKASH